jgi:chromosome transmission fidelity protein 18
MSSDVYSDLPSGFDLYSELPEDVVAAPQQTTDPSFSEDIAILNAELAADRETKTRDGIVIQHRAWTLNEAFQSDQDLPTGSPSTRYSTTKLPIFSMPSSPPIDLTVDDHLALQSVSPGKTASSRKRIRLDTDRSPLKPTDGNVRMRAGFMIESDDEDDEPALIHKSVKANNLFLPKSPVSSPLIQESQLQDVPALELPSLDTRVADDMELPTMLTMTTFSGRNVLIGERLKRKTVSYERIVASRSVAEEGRAEKSFYGIDMHNLLETVNAEKKIAESQKELMEVEAAPVAPAQSCAKPNNSRNILWTEKYRARKFTDLIGDERTHRLVMHWLKSWDPIVFPGMQSAKKGFMKRKSPQEEPARRPKILLLTGPPGLGKTTLAHVCARQAGYEVHEINASDERSRDVVKGKIRDMVGTENVRGLNQKTASGIVRKSGRPVCVVVDEVDGVVGSSGAGEGGFVKALIDLIMLDQKNSTISSKRKGDKFRMLRPLVLICNDVYHPSLRQLRQSPFAEIVHVRKPAIHNVSSRLHGIFEREGVPSDADGIRRLCEATWGVSTRKDAQLLSGGTSDGDVRSVLVVAEWVATRFKAKAMSCGEHRLTKRWIEEHVLAELAYGGGGARSLGRGSSKEVVDRVFLENAGFVKTQIESQADTHARAGKSGVVGVSEAPRRRAMHRLQDLIHACGEIDRVVTGKNLL